MRVLIIGNARYMHLRRWTAGLVAAGADVFALPYETCDDFPCPVVSGGVPAWRPWRPQRWVQRRQAVVRKAIREIKPDLVHVQLLSAFSVFPEDLGTIPLIVTPWGSEIVLSDDESSDVKQRKIDILRAAKRITASSKFLADATRQYAGVCQVDLLYWGVDLEQFRPAHDHSQEPVIGFVKHLKPIYGPQFLLEAFVQVKRHVPRARLLMVGTGPMEQTLKRRAEELGISNSIDWRGHIAHVEIPQLFSQMTVFVMPSLSESLGVAALESQAMKVPVVATNVGGIPEAVLHGESGILVQPGDSQTLAKSIIHLLEAPQRCLRMGEKGRVHVERRFDWRHTIAGMLETYEGALAS